jgi:hypothetical protein
MIDFTKPVVWTLRVRATRPMSFPVVDDLPRRKAKTKKVKRGK